jgi:hypothetical protein
MKSQYRKKISKKHLYKEFVRVLNGLLQLSDREAEVLALLMGIDANWRPVLETEKKNILSTDNRRALMEETRINKNNLTKYLNTLKEKGLLVGDSETGYSINSIFMPKQTGGIVEIIFILDFENN